MYTSDELLAEIKRKHQILKNRDPAEVALKNLFAERNDKECLQHSIRLSRPTGGLLSDLSAKEKKLANKEYLRTFDNLQKAWLFGMENYKFPIDQKFLFDIAYQIEPENYKTGKAEYRTMGVRPSGALVTPPYPAKLLSEMNNFFENLNLLYNHYIKHKEEDSIDLSSFIHLELTRIHPFEDGNGRVARLMGNLVLIANNYPPLIIQEGERKTYHDMLRNYDIGLADRDRKLAKNRDELSDQERMTYDYFAGKINTSLDRILEGKNS